jgi:Anti-sigma-28 factor, FlgM
MTSEVGGQDSCRDRDRIARIRSAIAEGRYVVDPELVAEAVLSAWRMDDVVERWRTVHSTGSGGGAEDSTS